MEGEGRGRGGVLFCARPNSPFHGYLFSFALQWLWTWMWGNFGQFCTICPKLPHIHVQLYCNANEKSELWKGLFSSVQNAKNASNLRKALYPVRKRLPRRLEGKQFNCCMWTCLDIHAVIQQSKLISTKSDYLQKLKVSSILFLIPRAVNLF